MGYNIEIGNAVPYAKEGRFGWRVEHIKLDYAPTFPNDWLTGKSNSRSPSYSGWSDFCRLTGLYDLFFEEYEGLMHRHPGIVPLTKEHHANIKAALEKFQAQHPYTIPGCKGYPDDEDAEPFDGDEYSYNLARLIWLEWWMRWALDNCEHPAIENS